jgi:hypothetical protein
MTLRRVNNVDSLSSNLCTQSDELCHHGQIQIANSPVMGRLIKAANPPHAQLHVVKSDLFHFKREAEKIAII